MQLIDQQNHFNLGNLGKKLIELHFIRNWWKTIIWMLSLQDAGWHTRLLKDSEEKAEKLSKYDKYEEWRPGTLNQYHIDSHIFSFLRKLLHVVMWITANCNFMGLSTCSPFRMTQQWSADPGTILYSTVIYTSVLPAKHYYVNIQRIFDHLLVTFMFTPFLYAQSPTVNPYQHEWPSPPEESKKIPISVKLFMYIADC